MKYVDRIYEDFQQRINDIASITDVNDVLIEVVQNDLNAFKKEVEDTGQFGNLLQNIQKRIDKYKTTAQLPQLQSRYPILREQMIVLIISAQETFLIDLIRGVANEEPQKLQWRKKEKISFDHVLLQTSFTLGDAVINHIQNKGYSFQDLNSSLEALKQYLDCHVELKKDTVDRLVLSAAYRNVIIHNRAQVDHGFLKQIRDTQFADKFAVDNSLSIEKQDVEYLTLASLSFAETVIEGLNKNGAE